MNIEEYLELFTASERDRFSRACRRLLKQTFIVRDRNDDSRKLYFFISKNAELFSAYFQCIGFDIIVDRDNGVIMLKNYADESGRERVMSNRLQLKKDESIILCCLWTIYVDNLREGNLTRPILVSVADLRFALEKFGIRDEVDKSTLRRALKLFSQFQLVEVNGTIGDPDCLIRLYPSMEFALDTDEFKRFVEVAEKRMKDHASAEEEDEDE